MKRSTMKKKFWLIPLLIGGLAVLILVIMALWNGLMPTIFQLPQIGYWQAAGLLLLARLLFGFGRHWHGPRHSPGFFHDKWQNLTPEERDRFRDRMRKRSRFWDDPRSAGADGMVREHSTSDEPEDNSQRKERNKCRDCHHRHSWHER
ncbi:MAG: hypothetical protein QM786_13105 [Breznakibacter sp.]